MTLGDSTFSKKRWHNLFTEGQQDANDDVRPGFLSTSTTDENVGIVKKIAMENHRITESELLPHTI